MPEAVIVSAVRSPIGRASKGSLVDMRPDELTVQMVRAALDKVPALDPRDINEQQGYGRTVSGPIASVRIGYSIFHRQQSPCLSRVEPSPSRLLPSWARSVADLG